MACRLPGMFLVSDERIIKSHQAAHPGDHANLKTFENGTIS
ncbi:hypothetical protein N8586_04350 [Verrucomicrobiales bacterium]|nr:hypothetical protein [Verrucomicrobiales bacterium]